MRPSDLQSAGPREESCEWALPYPRSEHADPPITVDEARNAETAVCCWHQGTIVRERTATDAYGRVYFCPVGSSYWRLSEPNAGMYGPLLYREDSIA